MGEVVVGFRVHPAAALVLNRVVFLQVRLVIMLTKMVFLQATTIMLIGSLIKKYVLIAYDFYWELVEYYSEYTAENTIFKCFKHCPRVLNQSFQGVRGLHLAWYTARELGLG